MLLFLIYSAVFVWNWTKRLFPLEKDIVAKQVGFTEILKTSFQQPVAGGEINPGWFLLVLSLLYLILLICVELIDFQGKKLIAIKIERTGVQLKTYSAALLSYYYVLTLFILFCMLRIYIRKGSKCENYGTDISCCKCFPKNNFFDIMVIFMIITWLIAIGWGVIFNWIYGRVEYIIWSTCGIPAILLYLRGLVFFILNDFEYTQDVEKLNNYIDQHNQAIDEAESKKKQT